MCVPLTLRGRCRKGLGMQQIQGALILLLVASRRRLLGSTPLLVVQLATLGQEFGLAGLGGGLDHRHQWEALLLLPTGILLEYRIQVLYVHTQWSNVSLSR